MIASKRSAPWRTSLLLLATAVTLAAQPPGRRGAAAPPTLPDGPGQELTQRVCGSTCHGSELVTGKGRLRDAWGATVNSMISRGAKASETETGDIVEYLTKNFPPRSGTAGAGGAGFLGNGSDDAHVVDDMAADRGAYICQSQSLNLANRKGRSSCQNLKLFSLPRCL